MIIHVQLIQTDVDLLFSEGNLNNFWQMMKAMNVTYEVQLLRIRNYFSFIAKQRRDSICKEKINSFKSSTSRHALNTGEGRVFPLHIYVKNNAHLS